MSFMWWRRLLHKCGKIDAEIETMEIVADKETMKELFKAKEAIDKGDVVRWTTEQGEIEALILSSAYICKECQGSGEYWTNTPSKDFPDEWWDIVTECWLCQGSKVYVGYHNIDGWKEINWRINHPECYPKFAT